MKTNNRKATPPREKKKNTSINNRLEIEVFTWKKDFRKGHCQNVDNLLDPIICQKVNKRNLHVNITNNFIPTPER